MLRKQEPFRLHNVIEQHPDMVRNLLMSLKNSIADIREN